MSEFGRAWRRVLLLDPCVYCGDPAIGLDHIVAQASGGENNWTNRAPACRRCDAEKGNAALIVYLWATRAAERRLEHRIARREREGHPRLTVQQTIAMLTSRRRRFIKSVRVRSKAGNALDS